ncbi:hypothetical protein SISNIDRAFT_469449 [Sistotremastrum niveocremeum HHB9708]|uniref:Uncharacterized protein n=1 Tax=Sistotremastrum niveocremeum HHB9708 TaxID=1314777 RepID=A0A164Q8K5_9AGAM|nr:hypothetical protein SISNIDRAFT_469449 [Sistotremastrum niveocremeum HHB9708]
MPDSVATAVLLALALTFISCLAFFHTRPPTPNEAFRQCRLLLIKAMREISAEIRRLGVQRKALIKDLTDAVERDHIEMCKHYAASLDRTNKYISRYSRLHDMVKSLGGKVDSEKSSRVIVESMTRAMSTLSSSLSLESLAMSFAELDASSETLGSYAPEISETFQAIASEMSFQPQSHASEEQLLDRVLKEHGLKAPKSLAMEMIANPDRPSFSSGATAAEEASLLERIQALALPPSQI